MATAISWTTETWNPTTGCSRVSEGCRHCYAERISLKFGYSDRPWTEKNAIRNVQLKAERLRKPYAWKEPKRVFVNSMSDLFHPLIPDTYIAQVFKVMNDLSQHTFQILTKRPERAATWQGPWSPNIWMGTSVENRRALCRIDSLRSCSSNVRFLSLEPLLEPLADALDLSGIDWVIVGGESGPGFRPMEQSWCRNIKNLCVRKKIAFFYKQDSAFRTETRPWLMEEDGSKWEWHQYPNRLTPPKRV